MPIKACLAVPTAREPIELVAFLESAAGEAVDLAAVRTYLLQELGRVYVPKHLVHLAEGLPRTASGKPDQPALKRLAAERERDDGSDAAAGSAAAGDASSAAAAPAPSRPAATVQPPSQPLSAVLGPLVSEDGPKSPNSEDGPSRVRRWEVDLGSQIWKFALDHRYRGEGLFPGSGYVALAAEVAQATWADSWELLDLKFSKPLPLSPRRTLRIAATRQADQRQVDIEIASVEVVAGRAGAGEPIVHCTCRAAFQAGPTAPRGTPVDTDAATAYCVADLYAQLTDGGFDYGRQFQLVQTAHRGATSWEGREDTPLARGELQRRVGTGSTNRTHIVDAPICVCLRCCVSLPLRQREPRLLIRSAWGLIRSPDEAQPFPSWQRAPSCSTRSKWMPVSI